MYCRSVPLLSRSRVILSSQRLWPALCSHCVDFIIWIRALRFCQVKGVIPQLDRRLGGGMLVTEDAQAGSIEHKKSSQSCFKAQPARRQNAKKMPAREK